MDATCHGADASSAWAEPGMRTAADAIAIEHAVAPHGSDRWDDPGPANRPIKMNHAAISSVDDSGC